MSPRSAPFAPSPQLCIGLPVYNGEALLAEAIESLLAQSYTDFELIVSDNASTDRTPAIVEAFQARDPRVRYVRSPRNEGAAANFCAVARLSRAPLFKWSAHDDIYHPRYLERCVAALDADPGVVLAHADSLFIDADGTPFPDDAGSGGFIEPTTGAHYMPDPVDLAESRVAAMRFGHVVFASRWGTHMFGVIRSEALDRTRLIQNVPSADRPLLAELALLGRFHTVRERMFLKRFHGRMTLALTEAQVREYMGVDAEAYSKRGRQMQAFLAASQGKPVSLATRAACFGTVLAYGATVMARRFGSRVHPAVRPPVDGPKPAPATQNSISS
jgi:glycosyltransferase involved in cell wall biosynthesis